VKILPRSHRNHVARLLTVLGLAVLFSTLFGVMTTAVADAAPLRVRVRGAAKLTARATRDQTLSGASELVLTGALNDDAGHPLPLQKVTIRVARESNPHDERVAEALRTPHGCDIGGRGPSAWAVQAGGLNEVIATTDEEGRFCFRVGLDPDRYNAHLVYTPSGTQSLVDGVEREIGFDLSRRGLALRFDPAPRIIELDMPRLAFEAVAIVDDDANPRVASGLQLVLANEKEELARAVTDGSGRARFILPNAAKLGPPGPGELRVTFVGNSETAGASYSEEIERHVKVAVKVPAAERGELTPGVPEDGIPLVVDVTSSAGILSEGSVEARVGEVVVGAAPVERGMARLTLTFTAAGNEVLVHLRYVPASPWYEPLGEPAVRVPIRGPSLLSKAPILLAGLAVLAFFLVGRVSGQKNKPEPAPAKANGDARDGKPRIDVVRPAERGEEGWTGRVLDAHEGTPIPHARVWIERGTFEGRALLASVETDAEGRFIFGGIGARAGDETIAAEARLHARLAQNLPAPGEISITLVQRRRALLARLVQWARRRGPPFDARPEPTPGHVRRAASGEHATARWADAVERAVFGPGEVDARVEHDLDRLAPGPEEGKGREPEDEVQERR
jgi:hypothetical protein